MKNVCGKRCDLNFIALLILSFLFCRTNRYSSDPKRIDLEKLSKFEVGSHDEKMRLCFKELDKCLLDCNERFPTSLRGNYIPRGSCRDACVSILRESTDCMIFYQSSRK